jgi:hypothetical protein
MKRILMVLLAGMVGISAFAQEFKISGEAKSGILDEITEDGINEKKERTRAGNKDDAGNEQGRFRLNAEYLHNNLGFKLRLNWETWSSGDPTVAGGPVYSYAFGYGNFLDDQLTIAIGKLGASPWGSGGPDLWKELEQVNMTGGIRLEYKPSVVPGLNVGFVLNGFDGYTDMWPDYDPITILHVLQESVIGASYTHELFLARLAVRLDSEADNKDRSGGSPKEGVELLYRVEEHVIKNYLPDFRIWALGYYYGLGAEDELTYNAENWLFFQYAPEWFSTQLRFGYQAISNRSIFHFRPNFYVKLFDNMLNIGLEFKYAQDFGEGKIYEGSPFSKIEIEPKIQCNITPNAYVAFAYNWSREYVQNTKFYMEKNLEPLVQKQWFNLRFGIYF